MVEDLSLTTDLMVGFPGESEGDFSKTLEMVESCRFDAAFTFIYSSRRGTAASRIQDDLTAGEKQERLERLMNLTRSLTFRSMQEEIGKEKLALVYGPSRRDERIWAARTRNNKLVHFPRKEEDLRGRFVKLLITGSGSWSLKGDMAQLIG
jgi:tRNA-2-methylthio-N6-dimethylallyladenosine synthase